MHDWWWSFIHISKFFMPKVFSKCWCDISICIPGRYPFYREDSQDKTATYTLTTTCIPSHHCCRPSRGGRTDSHLTTLWGQCSVQTRLFCISLTAAMVYPCYIIIDLISLRASEMITADQIRCMGFSHQDHAACTIFMYPQLLSILPYSTDVPSNALFTLSIHPICGLPHSLNTPHIMSSRPLQKTTFP